MPNPNYATVRCTVPQNKSVSDVLAILTSTCAAGAQCAEVSASPVATSALAALKTTVTTAQASWSNRLTLATALAAAIEASDEDYALVRVATRVYEAAVGGVALGDAKVINKAGLQARFNTGSLVALGKVSAVFTKQGKLPGESIITWPAGPGATGYGIEVNFTPQSPNGTWTALTSGTSRSRTIKGPAPGSQFLVRIASQGSDGSQSEWSDPILSTSAF